MNQFHNSAFQAISLWLWCETWPKIHAESQWATAISYAEKQIAGKQKKNNNKKKAHRRWDIAQPTAPFNDSFTAKQFLVPSRANSLYSAMQTRCYEHHTLFHPFHGIFHEIHESISVPRCRQWLQASYRSCHWTKTKGSYPIEPNCNCHSIRKPSSLNKASKT